MILSARQCASSRAPRALSVWLLLGLLQGCVTETTGGFASRADSQALANYIELAGGYLGEGDLHNARRHLDNADAIDPDNSAVAALWGLVYDREGETALAEQHFRRALQLDVANAQARNNYAAFLFAQARYQEAYAQLQEVVTDTAYPGRAQAYENLGLSALRLQRVVEAEQAFNRALQLNDRQLRASLELTGLNLERGNVLQARQYYRNYLTLLQLDRLEQDARGLWLGIRLENALGNIDNLYAYGARLEAQFGASGEYALYLELLDTLEDD
ncbi:MAG TPA: type IV pilus biogenesis/stability protein PilW [Hyphomicrobiales bacterium]|nr:type IV pilus biogenesis/stability protein PilW [Hyphomicrobiales bacterium]